MHRGEHQEDEIRQLIAQEAARLMYEEGVREYRDAKRKAGRRYGAEKALSLGSHLPTNAEIHAELQRLLLLHEEKVLPERLLHLRLIALRTMERATTKQLRRLIATMTEPPDAPLTFDQSPT